MQTATRVLLNWLGVCCLAAVVATAMGCSGDSDTDSGACPNVAGTWKFEKHCEASLVGSTVTVDQNGCTISVPQYNFTGDMSGSGAFTITGAAPGGETMTCTGTATATTITEVCTESGGSTQCEIEMRKHSDSGTCPNVAGTWKFEKHCEASLVGSTVTVNQNGCTITVPQFNFTGDMSGSGAFTMTGASPSGQMMTCTGTATATTITEVCTESGGSSQCEIELRKQ